MNNNGFTGWREKGGKDMETKKGNENIKGKCLTNVSLSLIHI